MSGESNQVLWRGVRPVEGIRGVWPARNSTRVYESAFQEGVGTTIVYTVGAGKILFLASMFMCSRLTSNTLQAIKGIVRDAGDTETARLINQNFAFAGHQTSGMAYSPAVEALAGYDVCVICEHADATGRLIIAGWLEDA